MRGGIPCGIPKDMDNADTKTVYFRGSKVELSGKTETHHEGLFYVGVYLEGPSKGETVHVSARYVADYS